MASREKHHFLSAAFQCFQVEYLHINRGHHLNTENKQLRPPALSGVFSTSKDKDFSSLLFISADSSEIMYSA